MSKRIIPRRLTALPLNKPKTRTQMISYLKNHFRYDTMNSWNGRTSYAVNVKATKLQLTKDEVDRFFDLIEVPNTSRLSGFDAILEEFDKKHEYHWQTGMNGRSGGYVVLYQGERKDSGYKSRCTECSQLNYQPVPENPKPGECRCGVCNEDTRVNLESPVYSVRTFPGKDIDKDEDFAEWSTSDIRARVELVWDFDLTVERACRAFLKWMMNNKAEEREVLVPKKVTVAVPV